MGPVVHDTLKGSVAHVQPPPASVRRAEQVVAPGWVVLPSYRAGASVGMTRLAKASGFMRLVDSAFNYSVLGRRGFEIVADVVEASECHEFIYGGQLEDAVRAFDDLASSR